MISESGLWWFVRIATIISLNVNIRRYVCHSIDIRELNNKIGCDMKTIYLSLYKFDELSKEAQQNEVVIFSLKVEVFILMVIILRLEES